MADNFHILLLNGPNLNLLGTREPETYGHTTLPDIVSELTHQAGKLNVKLSHLQSNAEYQLIDRIHEAKGNVDYIIINPAAFTHTSVALRDALLAVSIPLSKCTCLMCMLVNLSAIIPISPILLPVSSAD